MTTFADGKARNIALDTEGTIIDHLDGLHHEGYQPEYSFFDMGNSFRLEGGEKLTVSFDLVMTVATANPSLTVYNSNNKGPMQLNGRNALAGETHAVGETIEKRVAITSDWTPRSEANRPHNYLEFYSTYGSGNYYSISNLMVELGEVAHPWRPAPEDLSTPSDVVYASDAADVGDVSGLASTEDVEDAVTTAAADATTKANAAAMTATSYITDLTDGIFVAPEGEGPNDTQTPTGWRIRDALELVKSGITYIKAWLNGTTPTVQIGASANGNYALIDDDSFDIYHGNTQMAHFGYGEGNTSSGTATAPYYTLGERKTTTDVYDASSTYEVGDHVLYGGVEYVCVSEIATPEAWTTGHWHKAVGNWSVAEGLDITASGYASHAEGWTTSAGGSYSHAEGNSTDASGLYSHAEGYNTDASGSAGHTEGQDTTASGYAGHAEGGFTTASGHLSHAEGNGTTASGNYSHAEGYDAIASGPFSHAQNFGTEASSDNQTALGKYNVKDANGTYAAIIGNGASNSARSNALAVRWDGHVDIADKLAYPYLVFDSLAWTSANISACKAAVADYRPCVARFSNGAVVEFDDDPQTDVYS